MRYCSGSSHTGYGSPGEGGRDAADGTRDKIEGCDDVSVDVDEHHQFDGERGEGGEASAQAGAEQKGHILRDEIVAGGQHGDGAENGTPREIDDQRGHGNVTGRRRYHESDEEAQGASYGTADHDHDQ